MVRLRGLEVGASVMGFLVDDDLAAEFLDFLFIT